MSNICQLRSAYALAWVGSAEDGIPVIDGQSPVRFMLADLHSAGDPESVISAQITRDIGES
jgi:hypothetical protein